MNRYYRTQKRNKGQKRGVTGYEGETLAAQLRRIKASGEGIGMDAPPIFTERKDGVLPQTDIRTDKFEEMIEAHDKVTEVRRAQRADKITKQIEQNNPPKGGENKA